MCLADFPGLGLSALPGICNSRQRATLKPIVLYQHHNLSYPNEIIKKKNQATEKWTQNINSTINAFFKPMSYANQNTMELSMKYLRYL